MSAWKYFAGDIYAIHLWFQKYAVLLFFEEVNVISNFNPLSTDGNSSYNLTF